MDLDRQRIETVIHAVTERLDGDWLLVGGALVALWFEPGRTTEDVDLVGIGGDRDRRLALFDLAAGLGLPIEALNTAADYFVERIPGWRDEIEPLHSGKRGTVYRPTPTLFLLLKAARLSEQDLSDCMGLLAAPGVGSVDVPRVLRALEGRGDGGDEALERRRSELRKRLSALR